VFVVLKSNHHDKWLDLQISSDDGGETTISALAKKRSSQDETFGYLGTRTNSPLMYLTSGELVRLITADPYWPQFAGYFPAAKSVVLLKLQEIGNVRNTLAHFRPLQPGDVEVVKQNASQVLSSIEEVLVEAIATGDVVPTNTTEPWYKNLSGLGSELVTVAFGQSRDQRWLRLSLTFSCVPLSMRPSRPATYAMYDVPSLASPEVLRLYPEITKSVLFLTEEVPYPGYQISYDHTFHKSLRFTFTRDTLASQHEALRPQFQDLIGRMTSEANLIREDNLARGSLVGTTRAFARATKHDDHTSWHFETSTLERPVRTGDPPRILGQLDRSRHQLHLGYPGVPMDACEGQQTCGNSILGDGPANNSLERTQPQREFMYDVAMLRRSARGR
jgi:hypothetical protein